MSTTLNQTCLVLVKLSENVFNILWFVVKEALVSFLFRYVHADSAIWYSRNVSDSLGLDYASDYIVLDARPIYWLKDDGLFFGLNFVAYGWSWESDR